MTNRATRMQENAARTTGWAVVAALAALAVAVPAQAAGIGPRMGLAVNPDQVNFGFQVHAADMVPHLGFVPSFEAGVGDNLVTFTANMDLKYVFTQGPSTWRPYVGGGPDVFFASPTRDRYNGESSTDVGMNIFGGMQTPTRSGYFFTEMRLGIIDSPDIKFTVGWQFLR